MELVSKQPTRKNPSAQFTGDVWLDEIARPRDADQRMTAALVRFAPGARTAWHSHVRGQTLHVVAGVALVGTRDGSVVRAFAGETVYVPPGEEHWHGATATDFMEHLAMQENADEGAETTTWLEHVSEPDFVSADRDTAG